ncbi:hypothetical protein TB2_014275 [Malus domestica]
MPMISQKRKRPFVSTRIPPLPSQSRSTSAIGAPPTFRQERNRPDFLRQTYLSRTQSHSMGGATRSDTPQLEPRNIDPPRPWRENTIPSLPCTRSQTMSGPNGTFLHHTQSQGAAGSQLDDTHNDLPTEAPARKRTAVRRRHGSKKFNKINVIYHEFKKTGNIVAEDVNMNFWLIFWRKI